MMGPVAGVVDFAVGECDPVPDLLQAPERGLGGTEPAVSTIIHAIDAGATMTLRSLVRSGLPLSRRLGQPSWRWWPV